MMVAIPTVWASPKAQHINAKVDQFYKKQLTILNRTNDLITEITLSKTSSGENRIALLRYIDRYKEYVLRVEFTRRLAHQVDSHYQNQNLTPFLIKHLGIMADHERKSPSPNKNLILFMMASKDILIKKPAYNTKPIELLEKFLNYTSITKVKTSSRFFQEQDYNNSRETYEAVTEKPENIGLALEEKINTSVIKTLEEYENELFKKAKNDELNLKAQENMENPPALTEELLSERPSPQKVTKPLPTIESQPSLLKKYPKSETLQKPTPAQSKTNKDNPNPIMDQEKFRLLFQKNK